MLGYSGMELRVYPLAFLLVICFFPITGTASLQSYEDLTCGPRLDTESGTTTASKPENFFECGPGLTTKGVTIPKGDIVLKNGSSLEIKCLLNPDKKGNYNSSSLVFVQNDKEVPSEYVTIINETAIRLFIKNPSTATFKCKLRTGPNNYEGLCVNMVFVGYPPIKVENFTCKSQNWLNMNCSWIPVHNDVKTCYRLYYYGKPKSHEYHCPGSNESHSEFQNYCLWNSSTDPLYRNVLETLYFKMEEWNALGQLTTRYEIDHYSVVVPNKAMKLKLVEATPSSLCISWEIPRDLAIFPPGLESKVMYLVSKRDSTYQWQLVNTSHLDVKDNKPTLNITGLKYAHTVYDIRVLLRSASAKDEPQWWSEPATITLRTKATVPGMAPKTDMGSFEIINYEDVRDVIIFWQQIPRYMENGDNFEYKVIRIEENIKGIKIERNISPIQKTKTYAKFSNLTNNAYKFYIVSSNKEGYSSDRSLISVPSRNRILPKPLTFTKIGHPHGVHEVSWSYANDVKIKSYTIYWCKNVQERPYPCKGFLNWTHVEKIIDTNITLEEDENYQFAISANSANFSSGMLWAECTVLPDQVRSKMKHTWINKIGPTFIEVGWKLDCFDRVKIRGFVISYCPILTPLNPSCKEPLKNKTIIGETAIHGNITELKPYTTYKVLIAVQTNKLVGIWSDPSLNTTLEAAPDTSPVNIRTLEVSNTTIRLAWNPPPSLNGALRNYLIYWNNNVSKVEDKSETVIANLTDLNSFEYYNISISACTVNCSPKSSIVRVRTKIGNPSQLPAPKVKFINSTEIMNVTWDTPLIPAGPVDHYDVRMELSDDGINVKESKRYDNNKQTSIQIRVSDCKAVGPSKFYRFYVRAVNFGEDGRSKYYGPWSPPGENSCYSSSAGLSMPSMVFLALVGVLFMLFTCFVFAFMTRCAWLRFKAMQNVGVKLPPQLELNSVFKDKSVADLPITAHVCSVPLKPHHPVELLDETTTPDHQLLLDNKLKDEGSCDSPCDELDMALETGSGEGHVESSGCGSGHDSVSSSITAGTHITDSGTEADERPASPDVFSQSPRRFSDLRQRNITGSGSGGGGGSGEGYSRLAAAPTGYVTLPQGPRTYVSHAHLWPHNGSVQQCHKGYVIAPPLTSTYSKVSLLPTTGLKVTSSGEHCADSENGARSDGQLSINPASSI